MVEEIPAGSRVRRNLGEPDSSLHRFELTEEGPNATKAVVPPVLEQARRLRGHLPLARVRQFAPAVNLLANPVDDGRQVVLLASGFELLRLFVKYQRGLLRGSLAPLRLRNRRDELSRAAAFNDLLRRLPSLVQFPVPTRAFVRRVEDRLFKEFSQNDACEPGVRIPTAPTFRSSQ